MCNKEDKEFLNRMVEKISDFGEGSLEFETRDVERLIRLTGFFSNKESLFEKRFDEIAKDMMVEWDLNSFKKTHPTLWEVIKKSII